ncbi:MAG: IS1595 family transposase [Chitinophagaceae bacterium]
MENSKLPYRIWLTVLYLMSMTKKGYSAKEMQNLHGHNRYEPIWLMMHKIRIMMGKRDQQYQLDGFVELDEGFFAGHRKQGINERGQPLKEIDRNEKVLVAVNRGDKGARYLKMTVVDSLSKKDIAYEVPKMIGKSATVITDGRRCYTPLESIVEEHQVHIIRIKKEVCNVFPWVHIAISNAQKKIKGIHHHVYNKYMQKYLNEFTYRFNRRNFNEKIFERLLIAVTAFAWFA